jgi:tetratricopeptide (TPR) repeat protein
MDKKLVLTVTFLGWSAVFAALAAAEPGEAMAKSHYNRGTELYNRGDFLSAERELSNAILMEPRAADAYYNRGWSYRRRGMNSEALADFSRALELYPDQLSYRLSRANVRIVLGDFEGAVRDATLAARSDPESSRAYFLRGVARLLMEEPQLALEDGVRSVALQPDYVDAKRLLLASLVMREAYLRYGWMPALPKAGERPMIKESLNAR